MRALLNGERYIRSAGIKTCTLLFLALHFSHAPTFLTAAVRILSSKEKGFRTRLLTIVISRLKVICP